MRQIPAVALLLLAACAASPVGGPGGDAGRTAAAESTLAELGTAVQAGVWLAPPDGPPLVAIAADAPLPVASAIKVAYLVELFAAFPGALDAPLPGASTVLDDARHPAVAHFTAAQRRTARDALGSASVRRIGEAMITGKDVDNATYNIAANLVTAHFGGPAGLQARLHARDAAWRGLSVRRYMLADRVAAGDNTATARSLAAVHGMLASGGVPGVDARAVAAARAVLARPADAAGRRVFQKGGSLDSDPVTRVEAGWVEGGGGGTLVHVVMLAKAVADAGERSGAGQHLAAGARRIRQALLDPRP